MIDNTLAKMLDALEKQGFQKEKQGIIRAVKDLEKVSDSIQNSIKGQMKKAIDDTNFEQLSHLQQTYQTAESLKTDLSVYTLFAEEAPNKEKHDEHPKAPPKTLPAVTTGLNAIVRNFIKELYAVTKNDQDLVSANDIYTEYNKYQQSHDPGHIGKMTNYRFFDQITENYGIKRTRINRTSYITGLRKRKLPKILRDPSELAVGINIEHINCGIGRITSIDDDTVDIKFNDRKNEAVFMIDDLIASKTVYLID